jgi:error-prone DNA polymerase
LKEFVHLHVHSPYSFLDGASPIERLLQKAKHFGMPAISLTDHNSLTGTIRFYDRAREMGIKPIIGAEVDVEGGYHLTLLVQDLKGYANLCHLLSEAHLAKPDSPPAATKEMLARHSSGLIALSGCSKGEIPSLVARGLPEEAKDAAAFYQSIYLKRFYIELVYHPNRDGRRSIYRLLEFARELCLPVVASNDVHYADMEEYAIHELLEAIRQIIPIEQLPNPRTVEQYLKSPAEMAALFRDIPEALSNTVAVAEQCNLELPLSEPKFPVFPLPTGHSAQSYLRKLAFEGASHKYGSLSSAILGRLEHELEVISFLGFETYFLVVWDIARFARVRGIRYQCRGSAVNSLVVYCLDISNVDPLEYDLLFERFMHQERREMPDIDLDFQRTRRDEVKEYITSKYGSNNVAAVATINTFQARSTIRQVAKALNLSESAVVALQAGVRWQSVKGLAACIDTLPELKTNRALRNPAFRGFLKLCSALDGLPRHLSVHLGGLVIGPGRLTDWVPLQWSGGGDVITQFDKDDVERLGLIKMDILAVPTLDVIEDTVAEVRRTRGIELNVDSIPRDDPVVFAMHREGDTIGCFQVESPAQREMAGRLLPERFDDLILLLALIRPGPMKSRMHEKYLKVRQGQQPLTYLDKRLEPVLKETLGQLVYQEQVLRIAHELAGMSYADADGLRRAMTHGRSPEEMEKIREAFISSCLGNSVPEAVAQTAWEEVSAFAAYGFPKGHAASYAIPAYQTLWLKCHYLPEFLVSVLNNQPMGYYPPWVLVQYARWKGIDVLPPDINRSMDRYSLEDGAIRVGLSQLKGISNPALASTLSARNKHGQFRSLDDFLLRTNMPKPTIEDLIKVGAFDSICSNWSLLISQLDSLLTSNKRRSHGKQNEMSLLDEIGSKNPTDTSSQSIDAALRQHYELDLLGLPLSRHPLDSLDGRIKGITKIKDLKKLPANLRVKLAVGVIRYQTPPIWDGTRVVYICAADETGIVDITLFSDAQERSGEALFKAGWLLVEGIVQRRGLHALSVIAYRITALQYPASRLSENRLGNHT